MLISLVLGTLFGNVFARVSDAPEEAATSMRGALSPSTVALADGDDMRARFIVIGTASFGPEAGTHRWGENTLGYRSNEWDPRRPPATSS